MGRTTDVPSFRADGNTIRLRFGRDPMLFVNDQPVRSILRFALVQDMSHQEIQVEAVYGNDVEWFEPDAHGAIAHEDPYAHGMGSVPSRRQALRVGGEWLPVSDITIHTNRRPYWTIEFTIGITALVRLEINQDADQPTAA